MGASDNRLTVRRFIGSVRSRLSLHRRLNFLLAALAPASIAALVAVLGSRGAVPHSLELTAYGAALLLLFLLVERCGRLLRPVSIEDAARHVDHATNAKERILTTVTCGEQARGAAPSAIPDDSVRELIESQAATFIEQYDRRSSERFSLDHFARVSLFTTPVVAIFGYLLLQRFDMPERKDMRGFSAGAERAEELRDLAASEDLPQAVKEELLQLATTLDEQGLYSEEAMRQLEENMDTIEALPEAGTNPENISVDESAISDQQPGRENDVARSAKESVDAKSGGSATVPEGMKPFEESPDSEQKGEESTPAEKSPDGAAHDAGTKGDSSKSAKTEPAKGSERASQDSSGAKTPPPDRPSEQMGSTQAEKEQQQKQQPQPPSDPSSGEKGDSQKQSASLQKMEEGSLEKGKSEKQDGEKQQQKQQGSKDGEKEQGGSGEGDKGQSGSKEDPNKSTVGVGDGKNGAKGEQGDAQSDGESGAGGNQRGAKDGNAQNNAQGGAGGAEQNGGSEQQQSGAQSAAGAKEQGSQGSKGANQGGQQPGEKQGGEKQGSEKQGGAQGGEKQGGQKGGSKDQGSKPGQQEGSAQQQRVNEVKEKLDQIKEQMGEKGGEQGNKEQGDQPGDQSGASAAGAQGQTGQGGSGEQQQSAPGSGPGAQPGKSPGKGKSPGNEQKGGSGGESKSQGDKNRDGSGGGDARPEGRKSNDSSMSGDRDSGQKNGGAKDNSGPARPDSAREEKGREADGSGKGNEQSPDQGDPKGDAQPGKNSDGALTRPNPKGSSNRPNAMPQPSDTAARLGPFGGGEDGSGGRGPERTETVTVAGEQPKIVVRTLGQSDGKRYKNEGEAHARTELGSDEFKKPEDEAQRGSQPIPVEYRGILK